MKITKIIILLLHIFIFHTNCSVTLTAKGTREYMYRLRGTVIDNNVLIYI